MVFKFARLQSVFLPCSVSSLLLNRPRIPMAYTLVNFCRSFKTLFLIFTLFNAIIGATAWPVGGTVRDTIPTDHTFPMIRHLQRDEQTPPDVQEPTTTCRGLLCGILSAPTVPIIPTVSISLSITPGCPDLGLPLCIAVEPGVSITAPPPPETTTTTTPTQSTTGQSTTTANVISDGTTRTRSITIAPVSAFVIPKFTPQTSSIPDPPTTTDALSSSEGNRTSTTTNIFSDGSTRVRLLFGSEPTPGTSSIPNPPTTTSGSSEGTESSAANTVPDETTGTHSILPVPAPISVGDSGPKPAPESPSLPNPPTITRDSGSSEGTQSTDVTLPTTSVDIPSASATNASSARSSSHTYQYLVISVVAGLTSFFFLVSVVLVCVKRKVWQKLCRVLLSMRLRGLLPATDAPVPYPFSVGQDGQKSGNGSEFRLEDPSASSKVSSQMPSAEIRHISIVQHLEETNSESARESWRRSLTPWTETDPSSHVRREIIHEQRTRMASLSPTQSVHHGNDTIRGQSSPFSNRATIASSCSSESLTMQGINILCDRVAERVRLSQHQEPATCNPSEWTNQAIVGDEDDADDDLGPPPSYSFK